MVATGRDTEDDTEETAPRAVLTAARESLGSTKTSFATSTGGLDVCEEVVLEVTTPTPLGEGGGGSGNPRHPRRENWAKSGSGVNLLSSD